MLNIKLTTETLSYAILVINLMEKAHSVEKRVDKTPSIPRCFAVEVDEVEQE